MPKKTALLLLVLSGALCATERRLQLPAFQYPPLAAQARVQGTVQLRVSLTSGELRSKPSVTAGHPLLAPAAAQAVERAEWTGCEDGERHLVFDFQLTDPCVPRGLSVDQTGPTHFQVALSQPNPCVFAMTEYVVRRFLFWKKRVVRCEEVCPPCLAGAP